MGYITVLFAVLARLCRPSQGVHVSPFGYARELLAEVRRRSSRVRRYAVNLPTVAELPASLPPLVPAPSKPADNLPATLPTFRVPADYVPVVDPANVTEPADVVRPYLCARTTARGALRGPTAARHRCPARHCCYREPRGGVGMNACGWWKFTVAGFRAEALCALGHGHEDDHEAPNGDVLVFPANAERIGRMCADHDADDSGTLCVREPGHAGTHHNSAGYQWGHGFASCPVADCEGRANHGDVHRDAQGNRVGPCGEQRPDYVGTPAVGRKRLPCVAEQGHEGPHRNAFRDVWRNDDAQDDAGTVERLHTCQRPRVRRFELADDTAAVGHVSACDAHAQEAETTAKAARLDSRAVPALVSDACGMLRVYADGITSDFRADPFACSAFPCLLAQGHDGPHEPDADDVKPCPVTNCALLAGHTGPCMSLDAEEFTA